MENAPWVPRQYHEVAVFDGNLWVMEGYDGTGNRRDVWYSPDGETWTEVPNTPWNPRHAASVFVYDNALWMVAGNNMQPDVWKLTRVKPVPEPSGSTMITNGGLVMMLFGRRVNRADAFFDLR
jgi:hypothetical protein